MMRFPGRSLGSLRTLTRELAIQCVFGENVLAQSGVIKEKVAELEKKYQQSSRF